MASQVSLPKGTRDFGPGVVRKRQFISNIIKSVFEKYGFEPLETPAMENIETLTGKYGDEGDKLMFRVLDNGDIYTPLSANWSTIDSSKKLVNALSEKALRYDLTIPFARFVAMNRSDITFPFKRYQIQPVWRADRPQKGRFREFYQCDADVVGSNSLLCEAELMQIYAEVFALLKLNNIELRINNRKILAGLAEWIEAPELLTSLTICIDKLDKIGLDGVKNELLKNNFNTNQIDKVNSFLQIRSKTPAETLLLLKTMFENLEIARQGIDELESTLQYFALLDKRTASVVVDTTLARGLNYYTGIIIEVKALDTQMGSIGGGGRYDNLTGVFGLPNVSGVGISFGLDRIYEVMDELALFPDGLQNAVQALFINFGGESEAKALVELQKLRLAGIAAELYPGNEKLKKQMEYANKKNIPYVLMNGEEEKKSGKFTFKNMLTGEQQLADIEEVITILKQTIA